jgi:hypothetical protein
MKGVQAARNDRLPSDWPGTPTLPELGSPIRNTLLRCYCGVLGLARSLIFGRFLSNRRAGFAPEPHGIVEVSGSIPLGSTK